MLPRQALASSEAGKRCFGSESAINDNLPLGQTSHATEVSGIEGIFVHASHEMVGLLYVTRNGNHFIQASSPAELARLLRALNATELAAEVAASKSGAYFQLPRPLAAAFQQGARGEVLSASCVGTKPM